MTFHRRRFAQTLVALSLFSIFSLASRSFGQQTPTPVPQPGTVTPPPGKTQEGPGQPVEDKHAFGVLPNYRTAESTVAFVPLTTKQKFKIATSDSFDYAVLVTTSFFAGLSQVDGTENQVYGQGVEGYAHRYVIAYADQVTGNYFPEAIVPALFHLDPRYFRKAEGSVPARFFYAVSRIFVCKTDKGNWTFNANEIVGNSLAATAAMSYHPYERTIGDAASQAGSFIESDMAGNILKEFWPDVKHWMKNRHNKSQDTN